MAISDAQFRIGVAGAAVLLAAGITAVRFCGSVELPPEPPPPPARTTRTAQLLDEANASPTVYQDYLAKDAALAGLPTPRYEDMTRALRYRESRAERRVLELDAPAIELAGLGLAARRRGDAIVLEIENRTSADLGYLVKTEPAPRTTGCTSVPAIPFDAMVIRAGARAVRVECAWRPGIAIAVVRVATIELPAMSAWYLSRVPPALVGIEPRIARGHQQVREQEPCISLMSQAVRAGLESGEIGWRDLVDFYARHRCQTYPFPASYRALTADGQRKIPAM